ncbi:MAG: flagellar protein FlaG [Pyrinomonadaceae bacterium]|nr:flagellar protein FlaG [Pyrinomonadaceae bacterium]
MQIANTLQPSEFHSTIERVSEKAEQPKVKIQTESNADENNEASQKLQELRSAFEDSNISLSFSQDEQTKAVVVKLVDKITGEEIRQIPTEVSLKLVAINAKLQGNFLDQES